MIGSDSFIRTFLRPSQDVTAVPFSFLHPFSTPQHQATNVQAPLHELISPQIVSDRMTPSPRHCQPLITDHSIPDISESAAEITSPEVKLLTQEATISDYDDLEDNIQLMDLIVRSSIEIENKSQTDLLDTFRNHSNVRLEVGNGNINKSISAESDSVFSSELCYYGNKACYHDNMVMMFNRGVFDLMYRTVYPEISLSGLEAHVFIVHRQSGLDTNNTTLCNHGMQGVFSLVSKIGRFDFVNNTLSISINKNREHLEDGVNGLCFVNNLFGEAVNANIVSSVLGCVEGYSFGYLMFYNVLSDGEPSVECFDAKGTPIVFDLCSE